MSGLSKKELVKIALKRKNSHFAAIAVAKRFVEVVERQNIDKKLGVTEDSNND